MKYSEKFQALADAAMDKVESVQPDKVDMLVKKGAILLDIRDPDEHAISHIVGSLNISRGKLEMNVEQMIPELGITVLCYCNANNRGALSAATLQSMGYLNATYIAGGLNDYRAISNNLRGVQE